MRTLPVCGLFVNKYELSQQVNTGAQVVIALSKVAISECPFFGASIRVTQFISIK
jgi:hypothetical protein